MLGKFVRDESGIAMGLAVIMIVLVGVMGAGLLVFVRNDLQAVVEVNQGKKALDATDAAIQAAEAQLRINARPLKYNGTDADAEDLAWSYSKSGKDITLAGNTANAKIQYLIPVPNGDPDLVRDPDYAPEVLPAGESNYPNGGSYFKVTSVGTSGNAKRAIEAIFKVQDTGMPSAWYSTGTIDWRGNAFEVENVSVFAREAVLNFRPNNLKGCDVVYEDWDRSPWNTVPRSASTQTCTRSDGTTFTGVPAGVGALGDISYKGGSSGRQGSVDYDVNTSPDFVTNTWTESGGTQDSNDISFPFNPDPGAQVDLEVLRSIAASGQNNSRLITASLGETINLDNYPSGPNTIYYVEFVDPADGDFVDAGGFSNPGTVDYNGSTSQGTIVVVNGNYEMKGNTTYTGIILLRDPVDDSQELEFRNNGNVTLNGFANVEGDVSIRGNVDSATPLVESSAEENITTGLGKRPGFHIVDQWSWRECYTETCS